MVEAYLTNITSIQGDCSSLNGNPCQTACKGGLPNSELPNETNRLWCPVSSRTEKDPFGHPLSLDVTTVTRGLCSPRCPTTILSYDQCENDNTVIIYNDGEVYTDRLGVQYLNGSVHLGLLGETCHGLGPGAAVEYDGWDDPPARNTGSKNPGNLTRREI